MYGFTTVYFDFTQHFNHVLVISIFSTLLINLNTNRKTFEDVAFTTIRREFQEQMGSRLFNFRCRLWILQYH
jgi:hypothetical protein